MLQNTLLIIAGIIIIAFLLLGIGNCGGAEHFRNYDIALRNTYSDTIYETSVRRVFKDFPAFICNILPTSKEADCIATDRTPYPKNLCAVHIIKLFDGTYFAVFNDGQIYYKDTITDSFWSGPLNKSMPEDTYPLRMISLTSDGSLLGVAYNNNLYKKPAPVAGNASSKGYKQYEAPWTLIPNCSNIIYVMYNSAPAGGTDTIIGINTTGGLVRKNYASIATEPFTAITNDPFPVLKVFFDKNNYMLGIGTDFKLYKKMGIDWTSTQFDVIAGGNPIPINDVIYDNDGILFGLVALPAMTVFELQKQQQAYYLSAFMPTEFNTLNEKTKALTKTYVLNDLDIIQFKTGANLSKLVGVADPLLLEGNSIDVVDNLLQFESQGKLRSFCAKKGYMSKSEYQNYDLLNQITAQTGKISKLNEVLNELIKQDPDKAKIQEISV